MVKLYISKFVVHQGGREPLFATAFGTFYSKEQAENSNLIQCRERYPNAYIEALDTFDIPDDYIDSAYLYRNQEE